ncbi:conserved hypothetical protein [Rhodococcus jostii RHA1]|uniref:DUF937 domain-containing protein n=1 Tax=Rhodococcus jostii (strain RHA1) TaxID=101510 RepID=Q0S731_RHOJR|nr:DUF937 domain-containing protein [Rhodococcus jostii]ABG96655.1 conserved hypothetical protein [Rhodococcus jostii RHA1]
MASIDDLLSQIPINQIARQLGVDEATAETAVKSALPTLVGGLGANAEDPNGAASLQSALHDHSGTTLLDGGIDIDQVDTADGDKIVSNIFGGERDRVASTLGGVGGSGVGSDLMKQLLPILAPIVLAYIAKQVTGGGSSAPQTQGSGQAGGGLGDVLGGLLGGSGGSGGLGGVLGGLLGKGAGDVLGGLLGGGKK